jgi:uncharacterized membrane protein
LSESAKEIERLLAQVEKRENEAEKLSREVEEAPVPAPAASEQLIRNVAESLATMREVSGLPSKSAGHFEEQIRLKQQATRRE